MNQPEPAAESYLLSVLAAMRERWKLVLLCVGLTALAALGISLVQPTRYSATASLLFRDPGFDQKLFGSSFVPQSADGARDAATNVKLVSLSGVAARTARAVGHGLTPREVEQRMTVDPGTDADVVSVTATDGSASFAAQLANTFATQYIDFRRETDRAMIRQAQRLVDGQLAGLSPADQRGQRGRSLSDRSEQLGVLSALQTGNAELVDTALPPDRASAPKVDRNVALGVVLGLLLGAGLALLARRLDRRLRDEHEVAEALARPLLGTVPQSDAIAGQGGTHELTRADAEAFRSLRANLKYFNVAREIRSLCVTSAMPGEGKTTVAWNLALATAVSGKRTLLIEADLRRPGFAQRLEGRSPRGLSTLLAVQMDLDEVAHEVQPDYEYEIADFGLSVVTAGPLPPNPAELLETARMREIVEQAEERYDFVVVDTPPLTVVPDATPLMGLVDGTILVSRVGVTTRDAAAALRRHVDHLSASVLGVVVNGVSTEADYYGYAHERDTAMGGGVRVRIPSS